MGYIPVTDLKKTKALSKQLESDSEIIVTRDGKPIAIMVGVDGDTVESSLQEIRRALFSAAIGRIRERAHESPVDPSLIETTLRRSRQDRKST